MPPRTAKQILAEWHELAMQREDATDSDISDGLAARIAQLRREYIEGAPPESASGRRQACRRRPRTSTTSPRSRCACR